MARIKDCTDDIANITQVAVLKQNVSYNCVTENVAQEFVMFVPLEHKE